ncbi:NAD(P)H-quinone oxidoreductase subunit L [Cyanobium sp. WAJ14-Wanaka]|uniref:NAD(P)H-quinone oxidoreductase subunit L n=1 Tax=Cyanobium sp. WAJ14-Wanaka TaxID=2823725 RepID=UPI0020CE6B35|nr:NAD(P)H-quinone oxidoreductase subunit L [Cyanobium sp. WAJ14-Wanaka]MCP9774983.1 NAD(P)H-quinone oxidoreductase subunit L [Cyanobium sp. WAJ14-Wanaka]
MNSITSSLGPWLTPEILLLIAAYVVIGGTYLVAVPLALYAWMIKRWTVMGKYERLGVYGLVFLFFPGLILFAPFINLRMAGQGEVA